MLHESLRMFMVCSSMKWAHLPWSGGIYDQHPKFVDDMYMIFSMRSQHEAEQERKRAAEQRKNQAKASSRRR